MSQHGLSARVLSRGLVLSTALALALVAPAHAAATRSIDDFAVAWSAVDAYSATLTMHETADQDVQDRTYAYTFKRPSNATIFIVKGPGRGGKLVWSGGDEVIGTPPGLFSAMKIHLAIADGRCTTLRGDTIAMASFGYVLDHFRQTPGALAEAPGPIVDGAPTTEISLAVANPVLDEGVTREIIVLSNATHLPVDVRRYIGLDLVKEIKYSDVIVRERAPQ